MVKLAKVLDALRPGKNNTRVEVPNVDKDESEANSDDELYSDAESRERNSKPSCQAVIC